jgi:hypothetical protein
MAETFVCGRSVRCQNGVLKCTRSLPLVAEVADLAKKKKELAEERLRKVTEELNELKLMLEQAECIDAGSRVGTLNDNPLTESLRLTLSGEFGQRAPATPKFLKDLAAISGNTMAVPARLPPSCDGEQDGNALEQPSMGRIGQLYNGRMSIIDPHDLSCSPSKLSPIVGKSESPNDGQNSPVPPSEVPVQSLISMFERKLASMDEALPAQEISEEAPSIKSATTERKPLAHLNHHSESNCNTSNQLAGQRSLHTITLGSKDGTTDSDWPLTESNEFYIDPSIEEKGHSISSPLRSFLGNVPGIHYSGQKQKKQKEKRVKGKENSNSNNENNSPLRGNVFQKRRCSSPLLSKKLFKSVNKKSSVLISNNYRPSSRPFNRHTKGPMIGSLGEKPSKFANLSNENVILGSSRRLKKPQSDRKKQQSQASRKNLRSSRTAKKNLSQSPPRQADIEKMLAVQDMSESMTERLSKPCLSAGPLMSRSGSIDGSQSGSSSSSYATAENGVSADADPKDWGSVLFEELSRSPQHGEGAAEYSCFAGHDAGDCGTPTILHEGDPNNFFFSSSSGSSFHQEVETLGSVHSPGGAVRATACV